MRRPPVRPRCVGSTIRPGFLASVNRLSPRRPRLRAGNRRQAGIRVGQKRMRPGTTCLYPAASIEPRSESAIARNPDSQPVVAPPPVCFLATLVTVVVRSLGVDRERRKI